MIIPRIERAPFPLFMPPSSINFCAVLNELVVQFLVSSFYAPSAELIAQLTKAGARQVVEDDSFSALLHCRMPRFPPPPSARFNGRIQRNASP